MGSVSVKVEPGQEKHPLVAMFGGQNVDFKEEIYQLKDPYDSKSVHMLLRLDTEKTDMTLKGIKRTDGDFGIAWARHWEKGRVFYCSLGHNHEMYWHPKVVRHYLAGIDGVATIQEGQIALGAAQLMLMPIEREQRVIRPHRVVVADRQQRSVEPRAADELHVEEHRGVALPLVDVKRQLAALGVHARSPHS